MELFSSDVRVGTSDPFPEKISPFPSSSFDSLLLAACEARVSAPDITHLPPQKLRPIRCNGKSTALVYNNHTEAAFDFQGSDGFGGQSSSLEEVGVGRLGELGFVVSNMRDELVVVEGGEAFRAGEVTTPIVDMDMRRTGEVQFKGRQKHLADPSTSSSFESEISGHLLDNAQGSGNRKRRRTRKTLEGYMQEVVSKVLLKQEMMHNKLMEMLERKERERLMREEAWKQQEMERMRREELDRAQETARNVAYIEFIQNVMGNDFQMAKPLQMGNSLKDEAEVYQQRDD